MSQINGAPSVVTQWENYEQEVAHAKRNRSRSVAGFKSDGYDEFSGTARWPSFDEIFTSQPRRYALSNATNRQLTSKPRGPAIRGPRTWMRHSAELPTLPDPVAELDQYYAGIENTIGRSAGTCKFRSNSERVVLAISQPPQTKWKDSLAGPGSASQAQGSLVILKVSSGSVQNWRRVKESGVAIHNPSKEDVAKHGTSSSHSQYQRRPLPGSSSHLESSEAPVLVNTKPSRQEPDNFQVKMENVSGHQMPTRSAHASSPHETSRNVVQLSTHATSPIGQEVHLPQTSYSHPNPATRHTRPLTEASPTWRNTPSWESSGWFSRGAIIDTNLDATVPPALRHGRSQPASNAHNWRPRYGAVVNKSFPFRPAPPQASKLGWSRFPLAGELEVAGGPLEEILPSDYYAVSYSRSEMSVKSSGGHAELNKNRLDEGGGGNGLSRLNPYVPRIAGATLSNHRKAVIKTAAQTSAYEKQHLDP